VRPLFVSYSQTKLHQPFRNYLTKNLTHVPLPTQNGSLKLSS